MIKCTHKPEGYAATLCEAMREVAEVYPTMKAKGVYQSEVVNTKTLEMKGTRILIKSGKHKGDGIVANVCPFCGGSLRDASHD